MAGRGTARIASGAARFAALLAILSVMVMLNLVSNPQSSFLHSVTQTKTSHIRSPSTNNTSDSTVSKDVLPLEAVQIGETDAHRNKTSHNPTTVANQRTLFDPTKYAYAYVIGGCNPNDGQYKGFVYNILISARILREEGARADVVAMFQVSSKSNATVLPNEDVAALTALGVKIMYIPKSELESFYDAVMHKFRILSLTQYRRVLLLDGDVMPISNLDYLFELSDGPNATIMENVLVTGYLEPANAGFFMLAPGEGEYEQLLDIIERREIEAANLTSWPKFDVDRGWGHVIEEDDQWELRDGSRGTKWVFHFAFSDQGLLYYWAKYAKQRVSFVYRTREGIEMVQNWSPSPTTGKAVLQERLTDPFKGRSKPRFKGGDCHEFMCDFRHFVGPSKPWTRAPPNDTVATMGKPTDDATLVWWHTLFTLNNELGLHLNFTAWNPTEPPLGYYAMPYHLEQRMVKRAEENNATATLDSVSNPNPNPPSLSTAARTEIRNNTSLISTSDLTGHSNDTFSSPKTVINQRTLFDPTKYAYVFVIGGCNPDDGQYKGFVYNILISARILREEGSRADVVAMFQMSSKSDATVLPKEDVAALTTLGVKIVYIPKSELESFYDAVMHKFRILSLTQYRRVLLLDGDVMPIGNLDYLFELSDGPNATIRENVLVMGYLEPANAGFFMLAPGEGDYQQLLDIIERREIEAANLTSWPKFDVDRGWGHVIQDDDQWELRDGSRGTQWVFHFAFSDQGLLYYWAKYVKQSVSFVHRTNEGIEMVQNWSPSPTRGKAVLQERLTDPFKGRSKPRFNGGDCIQFMCDFRHFVGPSKPWTKAPPNDTVATMGQPTDDATLVWWQTLFTLNNELGLHLNFTAWNPKEPPLGYYAMPYHLEQRMVKRSEENNATATLDSVLNPKPSALNTAGRTEISNNTSPISASDSTGHRNGNLPHPLTGTGQNPPWDPTKYAYAFVIGGCNPDDGQYKGFVYNILIGARILREEGSRADVVAMFQMSSKSNATVLPNEDVAALHALGVKIVYIPKSELESFYDAVMHKFRILSLIQYRRVLLMDGDVMPIGNLDYLFELSDGPNATIRENVLVMGYLEPANAGFFMLAPGEGEYQQLLNIIAQREVEAAYLTSWPKFDVDRGWGHVIQDDDQWETRKGLGGTKWDFHFAFSDQGLLYYWAKYVKQSVSFIHRTNEGIEMVQNWSPSPTRGKAVLQERLTDPFKGRSKPRFKGGDCHEFMCDFKHFTGSPKPWSTTPPNDIAVTMGQPTDDATLVWWQTLYSLNNELALHLDFTAWEPKEPPLGYYAMPFHLEQRMVKRAVENNATATPTATTTTS